MSLYQQKNQWFRKIIIRHKRIGYDLNVMRQSACLDVASDVQSQKRYKIMLTSASNDCVIFVFLRVSFVNISVNG